MLLALACVSRADISNLLPATVSGGSGTLNAIQAGGYSGTNPVPANGDSARSASVDITSYGRIRVHLTTGIFRIAI